jgi:hypothetical protein
MGDDAFYNDSIKNSKDDEALNAEGIFVAMKR